MIFEEIWNENYCIHDLIKYLQKTLESLNNINQNLKFEFISIMGRLKLKEANSLGTKT